MRRDRARQPWRHTLLAVVIAAAGLGQGAATASAQTPAGMPADVPAAASTPAPSLPEPSPTAWPFPSTFPQTSGTGRLAGGASLRSVTPVRGGPSLVTQPLPGTSTSLHWKLGARPAAASRMRLTLTDVAALTVDSAAARLRTGRMTVRTDGATRLTIAHLRRGTRVLVGGRRVATARRAGRVTVALGSGTSVVRLTRSHRAGRE